MYYRREAMAAPIVPLRLCAFVPLRQILYHGVAQS